MTESSVMWPVSKVLPAARRAFKALNEREQARVEQWREGRMHELTTKRRWFGLLAPYSEDRADKIVWAEERDLFGPLAAIKIASAMARRDTELLIKACEGCDSTTVVALSLTMAAFIGRHLEEASYG